MSTTATFGFLIFGFGLFWKATLLLLAIAGLNYLLRKHSAQHRYALWKAAFLALLLLPLFSVLMPGQFVLPLPQLAPQVFDEVPAELGKVPEWLAQLQGEGSSGPALADSRPLKRAIPTWLFWLPVLWFIGTFLLLARLLLEPLLLLMAVRQPGGQLPKHWQAMLENCRTQLGLSPTIRLYCARWVRTPMVFGARHPVIFLPVQARQWGQRESQIVLLHELTHISRKDTLAQLLAQGASALYWWHPLVWWAKRRLHLECEQSCDEQVVQAGIPAVDYASGLLAIARQSQATFLQAVAPIYRPSEFRNRLQHLLQIKDPAPSPLSSTYQWQLAGTCLIAAGLLASLSFGLKYEAASTIPDGNTIAAVTPAKAVEPTGRFHQMAAALLAEGQSLQTTTASLKSPEPEKRRQAFLALGAMGNRRHFYAIREAVRVEENPQAQTAALWALFRINCLPAFRWISTYSHSPEPEIAGFASFLLHNFKQQELRQWIKLNTQNPNANNWILENLQEIRQAGKEELLLQKLTDSPQQAKRLRAILHEDDKRTIPGKLGSAL